MEPQGASAPGPSTIKDATMNGSVVSAGAESLASAAASGELGVVESSQKLTKSITSDISSDNSVKHLSSSEHNHNHSAFNTLTQRFTNFNFGSDKSRSKSSKRASTLGKAGGNNGGNLSSLGNSTANSSDNHAVIGQNGDSGSTTTLRNKSNGSIVTSYDPMKLIGSNGEFLLRFILQILKIFLSF